MKIIIGLGNIGPKYTETRHNAGFMALDYLANTLSEGKAQWKEEPKLKAITTKIPYKNEIILLAKPTTFMNLSGQSVSKILNFFKEPTQNLTVIYDDIDLPLGKVRIRQKGSAGTHNGMKSIIQELGTPEFKRIRIGIESRGVSAPAQQELSSFVLSRFYGEELPHLKEAFEEITEEISSF